MSSNTLLVVDGTAMAYRAFYAIAGLTTKSGVPSNAVFGFIKLLRQLEQTWKPSHWVVTFDGGSPAERLALLESYKAQREEMPSSLRDQLELINQYLKCAAVPSELMDAQEADDLMATYAQWGRKDDAEILLATSDKDMLQLVEDRVSVVSLTKSGEKMGPAQVKEKTGVQPGQIVDWLALTGDSADNIPGVAGVGPKTAAKLLEQFGSLDSMWGRLDEVATETLRAKLQAAKDVVTRNQQMMRLRSDLPCALNWDVLAIRKPPYDTLAPFLEKMDFHSMLRELRESSSQLF